MTVERRFHGTTLRLVRDDITTLAVDAFVFYAQPDLKLGSGFGNAISLRAGPAVQEELNTLGPRAVTDVVLTGAGKLKAKHVLHAVGPTFQEEGLPEKLAATIRNALRLAENKGLKRIAFPPMGAGFYGVPLAQSIQITLDSIRDHLAGKTTLEEVILCANDGREYRPFQARLEQFSDS